MTPRADSAPQAPRQAGTAHDSFLTRPPGRARHGDVGADPQLMTADEAAMRLRVSRRTLERERDAGRLGCVRIRKRVFYTPAQLAAYARRQEERNMNIERKENDEECPAKRAQR